MNSRIYYICSLVNSIPLLTWLIINFASITTFSPRFSHMAWERATRRSSSFGHALAYLPTQVLPHECRNLRSLWPIIMGIRRSFIKFSWNSSSLCVSTPIALEGFLRLCKRRPRIITQVPWQTKSQGMLMLCSILENVVIVWYYLIWFMEKNSIL